MRSEILFNTDGCAGTTEEIKFLEHVEVLINIAYTVRGALEMRLTSPAGGSTRVKKHTASAGKRFPATRQHLFHKSHLLPT